MANESLYIIELLLQARDQTSSAVQKAIANLAGLEAAEKRAGRQADELREKFNRVFREFDENSTSLKRTNEDLKEFGDESEDALRAQERLDKATRAHQRSLAELGAEHRKTRLALHQVAEAQAEVTKLEDEEIAQLVRLRAASQEYAKIQEENADRIGKAEEAKTEALRKSAQQDRELRERVFREHREAADRQAALDEKAASDERRLRERVYREHAEAAERQKQLDLDAAKHDRELIERVYREHQEAGARQQALDNAEATAERVLRERVYREHAEAAERQSALDQAAADEEIALRNRVAKEHAEARNRQAQVERDYDALLSATARARKDAERGRERGADTEVQVKLDADVSRLEAKLAIVEAELNALDGKNVNVELDLKAAKFLAEAAAAKRALGGVGDESRNTNSLFGMLRQSLAGVGSNFDSSTGRIAAFDNMLRGLVTLGITIFLQQLVQIGGALVGMLFALAASAVQAGAALGGALIAGASQALPVLGVLAVAVSRVKGVMDAMKQANLLQQQESYKGAQEANKQATALDGVTSAHEALANAQRGVQKAQENLTKSRRDAVRQIQDLILAERAAQLAAEGAVLSQEDAQKALQAAILGGGDVARAQLQVKEADLGVDQSVRGVETAQEKLRVGRRPESTDAVQTAKESLADARRAQAQAERSLEQAQRASETADANISAASGKLAYLRSQMSDSEKNLLDAMLRLQKRFQTFGKDISAPIIDQFTFAVNRVSRLLGDDKIKGAARSLSSSVAGSIGGIFRSFTGKGTIDQLLGFAKDAEKNLKPLESIIKNVGHAFLNIGELAGPTLSGLLDSIKDVAKNFRAFTEDKSGRKSIQDFLADGLDALRQWGTLLFNVVRLFLAISGAGGADTGTKAVKDMGKAIGDAADDINTKGSKAREFFEDFFKTSRKVVDALKPIFVALAREFQKTFGEDTEKSVQGFATILADVVIPAIGDFIRKIGAATTAVGNWVKEHPGVAKFISSFLGILLVSTVLSKVLLIFQPLIGVLRVFGSVVGVVARHFGGFASIAEKIGLRVALLVGRIGPLSAAFDLLVTALEGIAAIGLGPIAIVAAIVAVVVILLAKFGLLDDAIRAVKGFFTGLWEEVEPPLGRLVDSFQNLWTKIREGGGVFSLISGFSSGVLKPLLKILVDIAAIILDVWGHSVGKVIGGVLDIISGAINVIVDLLAGDWQGAWKGAQQMALGFLHVLEGLFLAAPKIMLKLGKAILEGLKDGLAALGNALLGLFTGAFDSVLRWLGIRSPSTRAMDWGKAIVEGFVNGLKGIGRAVFSVFSGVTDRVWAALRAVRNFGERIVGLIREGIRREIRGLGIIGRWIWNSIKNAVESVGDLLGRVGRSVWNFIREAIRREISGFKNIGTWLWNTVKNAVDGVGDKLKDVGKSIIDRLVDGLKAARNIFRDAVRGIIKEMPGGELVLKAIDKVGGAISGAAGWVADKFATGGPVPGSGSGDTVRAWLTPGEHVLTKGEVAAAGGHAAVFALRRMLGGGFQGGPAFATGGAVYDPRTGAYHGGSTARSATTFNEGLTEAEMKAASAKASAARRDDLEDQRKTSVKAKQQRQQDLSTEREDYKKSGDQRAEDWRVMWNDMLTTTRRASNDVQTQIRQMRVGISATLSRLSRDVSKSWGAMFDSLSDVAYEGLKYIGSQTNKVLTALGEKHIDFGLAQPKKSKSEPTTTAIVTGGGKTVLQAIGGFVGNSGERGRDAVHTVLGRGEAVLNWGQQMAVNAAMAGQETLASILGRTRGWHAGGSGAPGYAQGRPGDLFDGHPSNVNSAVRSLIELMKRKFGLIVTSTTDHGLTRRGTRSDHQDGNAVDLGGASDTMLRAANYVKSSGLYKKLKQGIHNPNLAVNAGKLVSPSFYAGDWAGHVDHLHLAIIGALGKFSAGAGDVTGEIKRRVVTGPPGALSTIAKNILDTVRKAANAKLDTSGAAGDTDLHGFEKGTNESNVALGRRMARAYGWTGGMFEALRKLWIGESNWNEKAYNTSSGATGIPQSLPGNKMASEGSDWKTNPATQIAWGLKYIKERYKNPSAAYAQWMARNPHWYAMGGQVPGGDGQPVPIVAHAGEWVLNKLQQSKLAQLAGTGVGRLRDSLGFTGGPHSYAGGGEVLQIGDSLSVGIQGYLKKMVQGLVTDARVGRNSDEAVAILKKKLKDAYKEVIFDVGTNDGHAAMLKRNLKKAHQLLNDDQTMVVSTVRGPGASAKNAVIKEFADLYDNVRLVTASNKGSAGDNIHYTAAGYKARASRFASAVNAGGDDSGTGTTLSAAELAAMSPEETRALIRKAAKTLSKLKDVTKSTNRLKNFIGLIGKFTDETTGFIDQWNAAIEARSTEMTNTLALAQQGFRRVGNRIRRIRDKTGKIDPKGILTDPGKIAQQEADLLKLTGDDLRTGRDITATAADKTDVALARIERGGVTSKEKTLYDQLLAKRKNLADKLTDYDTKLAQNYADRYAKQQEIFQAQTDKLLSGNTRATAANESARRIGDIFGLDTTAQANTARDLAKDREATLRARLAVAVGKARTDPRWQETVDALTEQVQSAAEASASATHDALAAVIDSIAKRYESNATARDLSTRLATLTGNQGTIAANLAAGIVDLNGQIADYAAQAVAAHNVGDLGLETEMTKQVNELGVQVQEKTAEMIQQAVDAAETAFTNAEARRAITGRAADLLERAGSKTGAILKREGISDARLGDLRTEQAAVRAQLDAANAAGLTVLADTLRLKFDDLGQSIEEEIQTRKDLTYQYRQASLDIITGKTTRATGLIGSAQDLLTRIAVNAGGVFDPRALLQKAGEELAKAIPGIADQVLAGSGEFGGGAGGVLESLRSAFLAGPGDFATKLAELGPTIADLESTMGDAQKTTFQALIQAMLDNSSSVVDNTKSLKDATGALSGPQSFASSSWTWFRNAIFSGMGDVLPKYDIPHMQTGGSVRRRGIFELHPGEFVVNPEGSNIPDSGDINITMNSVNGDVDLTALAARIAFAKKSRG